MARIKGAVNAHKKRRKIMKLAKGYYGSKSKQYRAAQRAGHALPALRLHRPQACVSATSVPCGSPVSTPRPA